MLKKLITFYKSIFVIIEQIDQLKQSIGRIENRQLNGYSIDDNNEFKVYSQSGEDGIIQWIISKLNISNKYFIEFGVENYLESNTRFLALNNYWKGLVIDGSLDNINEIKKDPISWRCNISAIHSFITAENINDIFKLNNVPSEIALLSIDIDGNDYWVLKSINCVTSAVIIVEYNSFFGCEKKVTVPYNPSFVRDSAHFSKIYYGASISALNSLANDKGYRLVASNRAGNNLFFVREDLMNNFKEISIKEAYRPINFRECHNEDNKLIFPTFEEAKELIGDLMVLDLESDTLIKVNAL